MKVIAINGSPKANGNTFHAIEMVADELKAENIEVEIVHIGNKHIRGCIACNKCGERKDERCIIEDDVNELIQKVKDADGILLGSPVYYSGIAGTMKSFLDRFFQVAYMNDEMLRHKVGASVVAVRRSGGTATFNQLNIYINHAEMIMPASHYWHVIHGTLPGEAVKDLEGVSIMKQLGKNMAWTLKSLLDGKKNHNLPLAGEKVYTSFIR
ncbi:flavodoxin family protein [Acidaminobacter sp. JC074]|uniref:flavodoxin family protein n=1 Tax=Acidaminobacter sp. JC074 TaxID=2530199 RepID=UPI001F1174FD|nr:flavodoxin family protein [Acidaminobacter sp. JC074]MCH4889237.1 flavodoxin family protein [Acidaminobacter sp. JC074]